MSGRNHNSEFGILFAFALGLAFASTAFAQNMYSGGGGIMAPSANVKPPGLTNVGLEQRLNAQVPADLAFRDETGKPVKLGEYFGKRPLILSLVYFRCPMLCNEVLAGVEGSLKAISFNPGQDFDVLTVSFDPKDTPESATEKKAEMLKHYKRDGAAGGWHFLTGSQESIDALTKAVGFQYQYDNTTDQFAHTTGLMILTPDGKVAQYYYGVNFPPRDVRLGLIQASQGKIGTLADQVLLYCYHYDPKTGKYSAMINRIIQLGGGLTILSIGAVVLVLLRRGSDSELRGHGRA
ncbi:MAG: SCO family protein [Acidobacteria bacterium]|nr:MAG: SCO family protein [Acidobacteriota bacterium]